MIYTNSLQQVFENLDFKISIASALSYIQLTWLKYPASEEYRRGYRQTISVALELDAKYWLTDARKVTILQLADHNWIFAKMRPLLKGGKLLKFAIAMQPETFMMTRRNPFSDEPETDLKMLNNFDIFLDIASARDWLLSKA